MPKSSRPLAVVVLAAGKGKRMKSKRPKVLHDVCGRPALWHVLGATAALKPEKLVIVTNHERDHVEEQILSWGFTPEPVFVDQGEPLGTGHAVLAAEPEVSRAEDVLVLPGDEPLVTTEMLRDLLRYHRRTGDAATILGAWVDDPTGYGRIVHEDGELDRVVEEKNATAAEKRIHEVTTCVYAFRRPALFAALPLIGNDNKQREYLLPDVIHLLHEKGEPLGLRFGDFGGTLGINSRADLARAAAVMRSRIAARHQERGVMIVDPSQTYIEAGVRIGAESVIHPGTFLEGETVIGDFCDIGPNTRMRDTTVRDRSSVQFSVVTGARIGKNCTVGPFTHIRSGTELADGVKTGSFVEIKASKIGKGSKVPHLSYVGDAKLGANVNIGAGTVTVNYDGYEKHRTEIGDDARIGSDTMLVAPVKVGRGAVTGAGSVISKDVAPGALAVERAEQREVKGYRKRKDAEKEKRKQGKKGA